MIEKTSKNWILEEKRNPHPAARRGLGAERDGVWDNDTWNTYHFFPRARFSSGWASAAKDVASNGLWARGTPGRLAHAKNSTASTNLLVPLPSLFGREHMCLGNKLEFVMLLGFSLAVSFPSLSRPLLIRKHRIGPGVWLWCAGCRGWQIPRTGFWDI